MSPFLRGVTTQLRHMFLPGRFLVLLALLFFVSFASMGIYWFYVVRDMPVAVLDFDRSKVSRSILEYLSATREIRLVDTSDINSPEDAVAKLDRGEIMAAIVIPNDLSAKVKAGKPAILPVYIDMSNILTGKNLYKGIAKAVGTVSAGVQLQLVKKLGERKQKAMARVVPLVVEEGFLFNPATNYIIYIVPGLLFYFINVYLSILAASVFIGAEAPRGARELFGRMTGLFVWGVALESAYIWWMMPITNIFTPTAPAVILSLTALFVLGLILMASAFYALYRIPLLALQSTIICAMLSLMLSGITWPTDTFPPVLRFISYLFPFTYFAKSYQSFLHLPVSFDDMQRFTDGMIGLIVLYAGLCAAGLILHAAKRRLLRPKRGGLA